MKHIFLLLFLFIAQGSFSQKTLSIIGYVSDSKTGESISDANISSKDAYGISNTHGFYTLQLAEGKHVVKVSFVGYLPSEQEIDVRHDSMINISLEAGIGLPEFVLTTNKNNHIDSRGLGNMRINVSQLRVSPLFFGERDVIKTLQFLPGVSSGMEGSSHLNIRGGTNDQTLYLMDDVPIYSQNHTFGLFSIFNPDALLSADLYKGGIPSIYGDRLSGVAAIALKDGNDKQHKRSLGIGLLSLNMALEGPILKDKLSYLFTARRSFFDILYNGMVSLMQDGEGGGGMISFYDINGKLSWKINPKTKLSWQIYAGYDDLYGQNKEKKDYSPEKFEESFGFGWKTNMTSLRLTSSLKSNLFSSTSIYYSQLNNFNYYKNKAVSYEGEKSSLRNNTSSLMNEIGLRSSMEQKINSVHSLSYGLTASAQVYRPSVMHKEVNDKRIDYQDDRLKLFSLSTYIYDEYRRGTWLFGAGLRASLYNNSDKTILALEPRIKANKFVGDHNKIMLAYDLTHQPVHSINEMNYNVQLDFWVPFKENKLPMSNQLSVGWKNYAIPKLTFSAEAYVKRMDNLLLVKNLENYLDFHTDYEMGKGKSMGLELMAEYAQNKFSTWISYTLSKSDRTFEGKTYPFKYDAPHDVSAFASYVVRKNARTTNSISTNVQYKSGYPYYVPEISYPSMGLPTLSSGYGGLDNVDLVDYIPQYPNIRLQNYFRTDLNFTMDQKMKHGSRIWQISLLNATGRKNPYAVYKFEGKYKAFVLIPFIPSFSFTRHF
ncbi:TonB-dependent receptor [Bacteroidales bacterium]|nr:TonB-dependent receptor [Bacteroidales bacterium]